MNILLLVAMIFAVPALGFSQSVFSDTLMDCPSKRLNISNTDSLRQQLALDSVSNQLIGHWQLKYYKTSSLPTYEPISATSIFFKENGYTEAYTDGKLVATCRLTLSMRWGYFYFNTTEQKARSFFHLSPKGIGRFRICGNRLLLNNNSSDGHALLFERVSNN